MDHRILLHMAPVDIAAIYRYMRVRKDIRREKLGRIKNIGTNTKIYEIHKTFMIKRKQTSLPTNKVDCEELGNLEHSKS